MAKKRKPRTTAPRKKSVRKRGGSSPKQKGNRLEREVAALLSTWWGKEFHRTPNSGALRWNGTIFTFGDLLPPEDFPCVVECKSYKGIDLDEVLRKQDPLVFQWFKQCSDDCARLEEVAKRKALPILIWKRTGLREPRICLEAEFAWKLLRHGNGRALPSMITLNNGLIHLAVFSLPDLLTFAPRDIFQSILQLHLSQ